jgi:mRNA interferase MazF
LKRGEVWWTDVLGASHMVVLLSRDAAYEGRDQVTVALVTTTIRGIKSEVELDQADGMDTQCCINLDNIFTIRKTSLRDPVTLLNPEVMDRVREAILYSLDLNKVNPFTGEWTVGLQRF